ncbi:hypothetical protein ACET3Z_008995 [Daucus carota]
MQKHKKNKPCYMDKLPTELKLKILSHLPIIDLATLACMDPEWRRLILSFVDEEELWKNMCFANNSWRIRWKKMGFNLYNSYNNLHDNFKWSWKDLYALWIACGDGYLYDYLLFEHAKEGLQKIKAAFRILGYDGPKVLESDRIGSRLNNPDCYTVMLGLEERVRKEAGSDVLLLDLFYLLRYSKQFIMLKSFCS